MRMMKVLLVACLLTGSVKLSAGFINIVMDPLAIVALQSTFIRCSVELDRDGMIDMIHHPFTFTVGKHTCDVDIWTDCNAETSVYEHLTCGCNAIFPVGSYTVVRQYIYFKKFPKEVKGPVSCGFGTLRLDSLNIEYIDFAESPGIEIYNCTGAEKELNWVFYLNDRILRETLKVSDVVWSFKRTAIASYNSETSTFKNLAKTPNRIVNKTTLPNLVLTKLDDQSVGQYSIKVIFQNGQSYTPPTFKQLAEKHIMHARQASRLRRDIMYADHTHTKRRLLDGDALQLNVTEAVQTENTSDLESLAVNVTLTSPSAMSEDTTAQEVFTISENLTETTLEHDLEKPIPEEPQSTRVLEGATFLLVAKPPARQLSVKVTAVKMITGTLLVTCKLQNASFLGSPEVNLTLWEGSKVLISKKGIMSIRYSIPISGADSYNFSCGITGLATECLAVYDSRREPTKLLQVTADDITTYSIALNFMVILFGILSVACVVQMLWVLSLVLEYVQSLMKLKRWKSERTLMIVSLTKSEKNVLLQELEDDDNETMASDRSVHMPYPKLGKGQRSPAKVV